MDDETKRIVHIRLEKAKDDLKWAHALFDQGGYRQAINRAYYAVFAASSAALNTQNITRKKHSGTESAFNQFFIKTDLIESRYAVIYKDAFKARQDADYADTTDFTAAKTRDIIETAALFVERVEKYLRDVGAIP